MTDDRTNARTDGAESQDRVEFRMWDPPESTVEKLTGRGTPNGRDERRDIYLVGPDSMVNAKVRDSTLEVKRLVGTVGVLQRWTPDPPVELPLTTEELDALLSDLGIPRRGNETWTERELLDPTLAVSSASTGRVVPVRKERQRFEIDGTRAEVTRVTFCDESQVSIAVEATDPDQVRRVIDELGLNGDNRPMHQAVADKARQPMS